MNLVDKYSSLYKVEKPYSFIRIRTEGIGEGEYARKYKGQVLIAMREEDEDGNVGYWFFTDRFTRGDIRGFVYNYRPNRYMQSGGGCILIDDKAISEKPANWDFHHECILGGKNHRIS